MPDASHDPDCTPLEDLIGVLEKILRSLDAVMWKTLGLGGVGGASRMSI